jgi:hypothetical protein
MEIIQPIKEYITECRKDDDFNDDSDSELIKLYFIQNKLNIPDNIQKLICNDYLYFEKIIKLYQDKFIKYQQNELSFDECIKKLSEKIIVNLNSENKIKYNNFDKDIFPWLIEIHFFTKLSEKMNLSSVSEKDAIEHLEQKKDIQEFKPRENQIEAFQHLEKNGLQSGIHCQATGCGKSYIFLKYIGYVFEHFRNPKIILFTERVNIFADLFDFKKSDFIDEIEFGGAATFFEFAGESDVNLFI